MIATQPSSPPSTTPPRTPRRPSMSKPMSWLSRASSISSHSHSHSGSASTTMRISEPKLVNDMFTATGGPMYTHTRYGALGTGATVVRTPQDALARAMLIQAQYPSQDPPGAVADRDDDESSYEEEPEPASPGSPPLPPLPYASKSSPDLLALSELGELVLERRTPSPTRSKPSRPCPSVPSTRPALKATATSPASLPAVPVLPLNISTTPPQPSFAPILLSPVPNTLLDLSSLLVTLETSTSTLRTTYATLTSRPSYLADYLQSLVRSGHDREQRNFRDTLVEEDEEYEDEEEDDGHKLSSPSTPFASLFAAHLTSAGLLPHSAGMIHLFLDRPSAPYAHILTYLRSPTSNATLPRTASLGIRHSQSHDRLEALLELRDEAKYLGLDELHKLCCDELRHRQGHIRGGSSSSNGSASGGSGNQQVILIGSERGRDTGLVRIGAITRREVQHAYKQEDKDRDSTGSVGYASVTSEVVHIEGVPVSPSTSLPPPRIMSPVNERSVSRSRSRSRGNPRSASDWI